MPAESSQTLDRGVRLLFALAEAAAGLSVTELAASLGVSRAVVYRLLTALSEHGLVRRSDGRVHLGLGVLQLAGRVQPQLRDAATPVLRRLAEVVGATAHLTVVDGGEALAVAAVEPTWTAYHVAYRVGSRHPLTRGAAGLAILCGREHAAAAAAGDQIQDAEESAYVSTTGELQPGAVGVAAPVLGVPGLEASIGVVSLTDLDDSVGARVVDAASELTALLT